LDRIGQNNDTHTKGQEHTLDIVEVLHIAVEHKEITTTVAAPSSGTVNHNGVQGPQG